MQQNMDYRIDMAKNSVWNFISVTPYAKQHLLHVKETGLFLAGSGYFTTLIHPMESFSIKLTVSGTGTLRYNDKQYELSNGDFFWLNCEEPAHYQTANNADHWHVLWLQFYGMGAKDYFDLFRALNKNSPVGHIQDNSRVRNKMEELLYLYQKDHEVLLADIRAANLITQVITGLLEAVSTNSNLPAPPPIIYSIREYLRENYTKTITLDELSEHFNLSKFYLQRTFSRCFGLSPHQYQQNVRLAQAKKLLRTTNASINMIAYQVGFESTSAFITTFKKSESVTPLKYRTDWSGINTF